MPEPEELVDHVALFDMDGTMCDFDGELARREALLRSPEEPVYAGWDDNLPDYIQARRALIKSQPGFWRNLPRLQAGFDILSVVKEFGFIIHMLTKGPKRTTSAWTEKAEWCLEHVPEAAMNISSDKSLVFGRILVDDFPNYYLKWLKARKRGLVIAPAQTWNKDETHPNVVRYDGTEESLALVREAVRQAYHRESGIRA